MLTDRTVHHNKPDILIIDRQNKIADIIDISVPNDENIRKAYAEKLRKYQDLAIELKDLYKLDSARVTALIISTNGLIPKSTITATSYLKLSDELIKDSQQAILLDSARKLRKFVSNARD